MTTVGKLFILFTIMVIVSADICKTCSSRRRRAITARIANGYQLTERDGRPYQAALFLRVGADGELGFCGGSLVHQQWILTAAHCCLHNGELVDTVQAVLGAHSLYDRYENGRRIVEVTEVQVHPEYDSATLANDLALLKLSSVVQLTDTIQLARLPYLNMTTYNFAGMAGTISGWGIAAEGVTFIAPTLQTKTMTIITDTFCNTLYSQQLPSNTICTLQFGSATCRGDNGGPVTIYNTLTEEDIMVGVASFVGLGGCSTELPSVFTRVQYHLDWISNTTGLVLL